jgi:hypothetical protein
MVCTGLPQRPDAPQQIVRHARNRKQSGSVLFGILDQTCLEF